nr:hypothetical protein Iba_chr02bCG19150 [Ipomoea batatas]
MPKFKSNQYLHSKNRSIKRRVNSNESPLSLVAISSFVYIFSFPSNKFKIFFFWCCNKPHPQVRMLISIQFSIKS